MNLRNELTMSSAPKNGVVSGRMLLLNFIGGDPRHHGFIFTALH